MTPRDAKRLVALSPTQRLEGLRGRTRFSACRGTIDELIGRYELFLENTDAHETDLIRKFERPATNRRLAGEIGHFGDLIWRLLQQVGGESRFLRMLAV